jgi:hypothetical protein
MRRIIHIIPVLFLWFAGLAVLAHMIIPHDHHLFDVYSYPADKCPASETNTGHGPGVPVHCHSLNDLKSEKALKYLIQEQLKYQDIIPGYPSDYSSLLSETYCTLLSEIQDQLPDLIPLTSSPFRAPPFLG